MMRAVSSFTPFRLRVLCASAVIPGLGTRGSVAQTVRLTLCPQRGSVVMIISPPRRGGRGDVPIVENNALDAVPQNGNIEVDEKSDRPASKPQIGQQLRFMDRPKRIDRLQFHYDRLIHYEIETVAAIELQPLQATGRAT